MKKLLITAALIIGALIPFLTGLREFYYLSVFLVFVFLIVTFRKRSLTLTDLIILFMVTIPLHTFRFGTQGRFIRLSEIAFVPVFICWVIVRLMNKAKEPLILKKELILLFVYLVINIISTQNSMYPAISWEKIFILGYLFLFTYIVSDVLNKADKIDTIVRTTIIISSASAVIAALQCVIPHFLIFGKVPIGKLFGITFYRAGVGWHDPNYYALYLGMNAAITLACILSFKKSAFLKICFAFQLIGIAATFSRTVGGSIILVSLYLLNYFQRKKILFVLSMAIILTAVIIATSMVTLYKKHAFLAAVVYRVADKEKIMKEPTLIMGHRAAAFIANWQMFLDHPILGVGPFMAMYNFAKYRPPGFESPARSWFASHNQYLQLLAEKGILGFLVFMGFILLILKHINRIIKGFRDNVLKTYLIGVKSAILVYLIASLALETSYELQFWLTIGIALALFNLIERQGNA